MWYAIVAILILIADQGLKYWVTVNIARSTPGTSRSFRACWS